MNTTKVDSRVVAIKPCLSSLKLRRPRTDAMTIAPNAPMAPPSVGVAIPRKMVPSTRKMSSKGGISVVSTRSSSLLPWVAGAVLGFGLNQLWQLPRQVQALPDGRFRLGGSVVPLVLFMAIFLMRYVLAVALNIEPELAHAPTLVLPACLLMGLSIGLLAARAWHVLGNAPRLPAALAV